MKPVFAFPKAEHYAFFYEEAHLLLFNWERDEKKDLFLITGQQDEVLHLDFPGELYSERVMELVSSIFFITVEEADHTAKYVLAAYFTIREQGYAVYYERAIDPPAELVFFRVQEDAGRYSLQVIEDEAEYALVSKEIEAMYV